MKRDVAKLLRAVIGLIEDELPQIRDSVVQADERAADAMHLALDVDGRMQILEQQILESRIAEQHSVKV